MITRKFCTLFVVTHIKFVVQEAEGYEILCHLEEELSEGLGPGCRTDTWLGDFGCLSFWGFRPYVLTRHPFAADLITLASGALAVGGYLFPGCGAETREHGKFFPSFSTSQTPANLSPSPGRWTPKGKWRQSVLAQESADGTLLITM